MPKYHHPINQQYGKYKKPENDFIKKITPDFTHTYFDPHYLCLLNDYYDVREGETFKILLGFREDFGDIEIIVTDKETERTSAYKLSLVVCNYLNLKYFKELF